MKCVKCSKSGDESVFNHFIDLSEEVGHHCFVIIKDVPCYVCRECGERFVDGKTMERLDAIAECVKNDLHTEVAVIVFDKFKE